MMKVWGRRDGSNVVKTMWCIGELGLEHERIDWGGKFGGNDDPQYRAMNPMGRLPTIKCDDGFVLWESGAIIRYLCATHSAGNLSPSNLQERARAERWMDWSSLSLSGFNAVYLDQFFRLPADERDESKMPMDDLSAHLAVNETSRACVIPSALPTFNCSRDR